MNVPDLTPLHRIDRPYRRCARCLLDTEGPHEIRFDEQGVCNFCHAYDEQVKKAYLPPETRRQKFEEAIAEIKKAGEGRRYDCIMGLSGGMDSSFIAYLAMANGLRPLIVHLDNGWDAELAVKNIENIIQRTGFDYYNYVVDWEEFKDMQLAYLRASVIDVEVVTDQAIFALLHIAADRLGIRHILFGDNPKTERTMPKGWGFQKNNLANMLAIHRKFGRRKIRSYPLMGTIDLEWYRRMRGIRYVSLLHYTDYSVQEVKGILEHEFGWRDYPWKHCESVFTRFYQGYILPRKNNVDKRKAHLSDQILSGQITREEGLARLNVPYYEGDGLQEDYDFAVRKFALTAEEFEAILAKPPVPHESFPMDKVDLAWRVKWKIWRLADLFAGIFRRGGRRLVGRRVWAGLHRGWLRRIETNLDKAIGT
jgi:N-acetyl sugar amidotransferase